jgi:hypothetical protein
VLRTFELHGGIIAYLVKVFYGDDVTVVSHGAKVVVQLGSTNKALNPGTLKSARSVLRTFELHGGIIAYLVKVFYGVDVTVVSHGAKVVVQLGSTN